MPVIPESYKGSLCELHANNNSLLLIGRISDITEGYIEVGKIDNDIPLIYYSTAVKMQIYTAEDGFIVLEGQVSISTNQFIRIANLVRITTEERRNSFRVISKSKIEMLKLFDEKDNPKKALKTEWIEAKLDNISMGGVHITVKDTIDVDGVVAIKVPELDSGIYKCRVKNRSQKNGKDKTFGYCCEFIYSRNESSNMDKLSYYIFNMQRKMIHKVKTYRE